MSSEGYSVLPADSKISSVEKLFEIYNCALECTEKKIILDASNVYWISPFSACLIASLYDRLSIYKIKRT